MIKDIKVGVFITDSKNKLLLIKEKVKKNSKPRWNIIKGTYAYVRGKRIKESVLDTARRECFEEMSVKVKIDHALDCYVINYNSDIQIQINFSAHIIGGKLKLPSLKRQALNQEMIVDYRWFTKKEIKKIKERDFVSKKIYKMINDWTPDRRFPLAIFKHITV